MSTDLTTFTFPITGAEIRTAHLDGKPMFAAVDICTALGIQNPSQAVRQHLDPDEFVQVSATLFSNEGGGPPTYNMVTESGMYALVLRSRKKEARQFRRWVTEVVLPALRRDGHIDLRAAEAPALPAGPDLESLEKQARIVATLTHALPADFVETKARLLVARAMGEKPEIDPARRPLSISDYLEPYSLSDKEQRSVSTRMGKAVKALYIAKHGTPPGTIPRLVNNHLKDVCAYVEADRPLMDAAFAQICPQPPMAINAA